MLLKKPLVILLLIFLPLAFKVNVTEAAILNFITKPESISKVLKWVDAAVDALRLYQSWTQNDDVTPTELAELKNRVSQLKISLRFSPELGEIKESIHRLINMINAMESRVHSLERQARADVPVIQHAISQYSGYSYFSFATNRGSINLNGEWKIVDTMESGRYKGLEIGFRMFFSQQGNTFTARGEKWWVNGQKIPTKQHSPLNITGTIQGNIVHGIFTEKGSTRELSGQFLWVIQDHTTMVGKFVSTATSHGPSIAAKVGW